MQYISRKLIFRRRVRKFLHWPLRREMIPFHTLQTYFEKGLFNIIILPNVLFQKHHCSVIWKFCPIQT